MSLERAGGLLDEAVEALQRSSFDQALGLANQAIALAPEEADGHHIRGIALARLGKSEEATGSMRQAAALDPGDARIRHNLAVHLAQVGDVAGAREMAREAVAIAPDHPGAQELLDRLEGRAPGETERAKEAPPVPAVVEERPGYESDPDVHSVPFVERLGGAWVVIGWVITGISFVAFLMLLGIFGPNLTGGNVNPGTMQAAEGSILFQPARILGLTAFLGMPLFVLIDQLDRRGSFLWLVPLILCNCLGLGWFVLGLYLSIGRKQLT